jgi:hypothetical protein
VSQRHEDKEQQGEPCCCQGHEEGDGYEKWAFQPVGDFREHGPTHDRPNMLAQIGLGGPYGPTYGSKRIARRISDIWPGTERTIFVFLTSLTSEFRFASCRPSFETGQHLEALPKRLVQEGVTGPMPRRALVRTRSYFAVVVMLGTGKWTASGPPRPSPRQKHEEDDWKAHGS